MGNLTLVVLAAGLSNAFGGRKQQTSVGPDGEFLYDYTIYDALSCGFGRIVFVVRQDNEAAVKEGFETRFGVSVPVSFVRQFRPLGTGHAVASTQGLVNGPFGIANATDLYGSAAMRLLADRLREFSPALGATPPFRGCVVSYRLGETMSEHGGVSRAVCRTGSDGRIESVDEILGIHGHEGGEIVGRYPDGSETVLSGDERVAMNLWGFDHGIVGALANGYDAWTYRLEPGQMGEYRLSSAVDHLLKEDQLEVEMLGGPQGTWMGLSHRGDVKRIQHALAESVERGDYPSSLRSAIRG